tara:strand:+ start:498 stop:713 length:216 start_codon:yes stop_codon:yes gene_type:complete
MVTLMIRFRDEAAMLEWVLGQIESEGLPERAQVRKTDALDKPREAYILDGGRDGGRPVSVRTTTVTTVVEG